MKRILLLLVPFIAAILMTVGCEHSSAPANTNKDQPAAESASVAQKVTAGPPRRKSLRRETVQPAHIDAFEEAPLLPKVAGYVEQVHVDIGDRVTEGQVLITISAPELQDDVQQQQALRTQSQSQVAQAEAAVRAAEAGVTTAQSLVSQAKAGVGRAEAEAERWRAEFNRISELAERGSISTKLVDETKNQFRAAESAREEATARIAASEAGLAESKANLEKAKADLGAARARVQVAEANLARAKTMLAYTEIRAPFAGVVTRRHVDPGYFVQPAGGSSANPLLVVTQADVVRVFADIPEMEAPLVDVGDEAVIRVQSLSSEKIQGTVTRTSWDLERTNRSLRTEIDVPNANGLLRPGMYATVSVLLDQRENVLTLPVAAIVRDGGAVLCRVVESDKIHRVPITLGLRSGDEVEITSGLTGEEAVVLARADGLQEGQPVEVLSPETK